MIQPIRIGQRLVGRDQPCFIVAEIGINHNGNISIARKLISAAVLSNCDAVKFQKRTVNTVYTPEELARPRESPFGRTNGDLKYGLEFGIARYRAIDEYCRMHNMLWFASCWDEASVDFIEQFNPPCYKIASACLTDDDLLRHHRRFHRPIILSTGMSSLSEIDHAVEVLGTDELIIMQSTSAYPTRAEELNLNAIHSLRERYRLPVGYSSHEVGLATTLAAAALGACMIERHITLDRTTWGSDQAAALEPHEFVRLNRDIREIESAMGNGVKRVYESEIPIMRKLRRVKRKRPSAPAVAKA